MSQCGVAREREREREREVGEGGRERERETDSGRLRGSRVCVVSLYIRIE